MHMKMPYYLLVNKEVIEPDMISLIGVPVEPDALNAIMRLCLRLTRCWELAAMFAELGGIRLLLALTQVSSTVQIFALFLVVCKETCRCYSIKYI
jgi:hypothetical protein